MKTIGAIILVLIGILIVMIEIIAILDPINSQMANDDDPFGKPPGIGIHVVLFCLAGGCFVLAHVLLKRDPPPQKP